MLESDWKQVQSLSDWLASLDGEQFAHYIEGHLNDKYMSEWDVLLNEEHLAHTSAVLNGLIKKIGSQQNNYQQRINTYRSAGDDEGAKRILSEMQAWQARSQPFKYLVDKRKAAARARQVGLHEQQLRGKRFNDRSTLYQLAGVVMDHREGNISNAELYAHLDAFQITLGESRVRTLAEWVSDKSPTI